MESSCSIVSICVLLHPSASIPLVAKLLLRYARYVAKLSLATRRSRWV